MTAPALLKPAEAALQLRCHRRTVLDLLHGGAFPNHLWNGLSGSGARYLIPQSDVDHHIQSRRARAA